MLFDTTMEFKDTPDCYNRLRQALAEADTVIIGTVHLGRICLYR